MMRKGMAVYGTVESGFEEVREAFVRNLEEGADVGAAVCVYLIGEVDGIRLLRPETVEAARNVEASGLDRVLLLRTDYGLGFLLPGGLLWPDFGARAFGQPGASGCLGFADPDSGIAFGYVPNKMTGFVEGNDERSRGLIDATYRAL